MFSWLGQIFLPYYFHHNRNHNISRVYVNMIKGIWQEHQLSNQLMQIEFKTLVFLMTEIQEYRKKHFTEPTTQPPVSVKLREFKLIKLCLKAYAFLDVNSARKDRQRVGYNTAMFSHDVMKWS